MHGQQNINKWLRYVTKSEGRHFLGIGLGKIDKCENRWCQKFVLVCLPSAAKDDEIERKSWQWALTIWRPTSFILQALCCHILSAEVNEVLTVRCVLRNGVSRRRIQNFSGRRMTTFTIRHWDGRVRRGPEVSSFFFFYILAPELLFF